MENRWLHGPLSGSWVLVGRHGVASACVGISPSSEPGALSYPCFPLCALSSLPNLIQSFIGTQLLHLLLLGLMGRGIICSPCLPAWLTELCALTLILARERGQL